MPIQTRPGNVNKHLGLIDRAPARRTAAQVQTAKEKKASAEKRMKQQKQDSQSKIQGLEKSIELEQAQRRKDQEDEGRMDVTQRVLVPSPGPPAPPSFAHSTSSPRLSSVGSTRYLSLLENNKRRRQARQRSGPASFPSQPPTPTPLRHSASSLSRRRSSGGLTRGRNDEDHSGSEIDESNSTDTKRRKVSHPESKGRSLESQSSDVKTLGDKRDVTIATKRG